jgi:16S rRNA processing protein RimM
MMGNRGSALSAPPATAVARPSAKDRVCVARVGAAHGIRGEVRLWSFTADPRAIAAYGALETADGTRCLEIEALRPAKEYFVARFKDITDRDAADRLCNVDLYVPRERLPAPDADEFYHADLIGLDALDVAGEALGKVVAIHNFGAGDLLEIAPPTGRDTILLPFTAAAVPTVEIAAGRIVVDPSRGLPDASDPGGVASREGRD